MTIQKGDVKLVKSQVMSDVPEGGGAPTANLVADGASNAIFPDVSESDRAAGRVSARKVHVWVQSDDTDTYLGANVIVAEPPNDPNVSITIMSTNETFDRRTSAISRIEAYLSVGANYAGFLFGNHIEGMRAVTIFQRTDDLPAIGSSLALTKREGYVDEVVQYVRITEAKVTLQTFTDASGDFQRYVLELKTSDPLRQDMPGFDVTRIDPTKAQLALATKVSNVIVADAAKYYGVVKLQDDAHINDFTIKAEGIFTQLVPSAQVETGIGDARTNQTLVGVVGGGAPVTFSSTLTFSPSQNLFIGGSILPKTLSLSNGGVTLTDDGGKLMSSGLQVGTVDYENGVLSLLSDVFPGERPFSITYQPAAAPTAVTQSQGFLVKIETRSLSYSRTFEPAPVAGTLSVSYMVASRWYVLRDDGSGALRGPDSSYGSGQINPTTGTVIVTLGALPDVGSSIIYQWIEPQAARDADELQLDNDGKLYWAFNTSGDSSTEPGSKAITPGALAITWNDGAFVRDVADDGVGNLTGYATGTVNYARGVIRMSPTTLPAPGTTVTVNVSTRTPLTASVVVASGAGSLGATGITPGSVQLTVVGQLRGKYLTAANVDWGAPAAYLITDDANGVLLMYLAGDLVPVGTINYAAGTFTLTGTTIIPPITALKLIAWDNVYTRTQEETQWSFEATA